MEYDYKRIYILLSKTETIPSNLIKLFTREPYSTHLWLLISVSMKCTVLQEEVCTTRLTVGSSVRI